MARTRQDPRYFKTYKTAVFEIHNPSQKKQRVLRDALRRNHLAYSKLLPVALGKLDELSKISGETKYRTNKARIDAVRKFISPEIVCLPLGNGAKAGLQEDIADSLAAYLALLDDYKKRCDEEEKKPEDMRKNISRPGLPTATRLTPFQQAHEEAYDALARSLTKEEEDTARDDIARENKSGLTRPILFMKNRINDGFLILFDEKKSRYFIYLNLHPQNSRFADMIDLGGLIDIRSGEVLPDKKTNRTGLLFPINFAAEFQNEKFLAAGKSATAKLTERNGRFEVHVAFEYQTLKIEPQTLLGVDRGIYNLASRCVIDDVGGIIAEKNFDGRHLRDVQQKEERRQRSTQKRGKIYKSSSRLAEANKSVHAAANSIVEMALKHKSQVVIENLSNLTNRTNKRGRSNFNRLLTRAQYTKLKSVLEYKLPLVGLPKPVSVAAQGTSQTCPDCGLWHSENRKKEPLPDGKGFAMDKFLCVECGYKKDADMNAARVIALKKKWRNELPKAQRSKTAKALSSTKYGFKCYLKSLKEKRK